MVYIRKCTLKTVLDDSRGLPQEYKITLRDNFYGIIICRTSIKLVFRVCIIFCLVLDCARTESKRKKQGCI